MKTSHGFRAVIAATLGLTLSLSACSSNDESADDTILYGSWVTGVPPVSNMWTNFLEEDKQLQEELGIKFKTKEYSNLQTLYNDLAQGRVDGVSSGPSTMAVSGSQGAPLHLVGLTARSTATIMGQKGSDWSAEALKGKRMVAATSTATWRLVESQIEDQFGLKPGEDYELVSAENISGAVSQLAAGTADYAMAWGEYIPNGLKQYDNIEVVADPESISGPYGEPFWQFSISVHDQVSSEDAEALVEASTEKIKWMKEHPEEVEKLAVEKGQTEGVAREMIEGLQSFDSQPVDQENRAQLEKEFKVLKGAGVMKELPSDDFYGQKD